MTFTARETALDVVNVTRGMGRGRVMGQSPVETARARFQTRTTALRRVEQAVGTERRFAREPSDADLDRMRDTLAGELDALVVPAPSEPTPSAPHRELGIGPRTWSMT